MNSAATYSTALVTYVDLLGFQDLIERSKSDEGEVGNVLDILSTVKEELAKGGRTHQDSRGRSVRIFYSHNFSDLTVRCTILAPSSSVGDLLDWETFYLAEKQASLALRGVFLRGGMCLGRIHTDSTFVFGPGLVKAYKLERDYAVFPRIVIDRQLVHDNQDIAKDYIRRGDDGAYFLDYLHGVFLRMHIWPDADESALSFLRSHKQRLERFISDNVRERDPRVRQKYLWLALYHNSVVQRLHERLQHTLEDASSFAGCEIDPESLWF